MKKHLFLAALAGLMLWAGAASATGTKLVKADTLAVHFADSSAVINVESAARGWVDFIIPPGPPCDLCNYTATADTPVTLIVEVREILSSAAGTDSTLTYSATSTAAELALSRQWVQGNAGNPDSTVIARALHYNDDLTAAAYSDSTVVPWPPQGLWAQTSGGAAVDTLERVNSVVRAVYVPGSQRIALTIPTRFIAGGVPSIRAARLELISPSGVPFRAQFMQLKWYMVSGPAAIKLRVVLGKETW